MMNDVWSMNGNMLEENDVPVKVFSKRMVKYNICD